MCLWFQLLKLEYHKLLLTLAFNFNLRNYIKDGKQLIERRTDLYQDGSNSGHELMMSALIDLLLLTVGRCRLDR